MINQISTIYFTANHGFTLDKYDETSVAITKEEWEELLNKQSKGMMIVALENGYPAVVPIERTEEDTKISIQNKKAVLLNEAKEQIDILTDVVETTNDEKYVSKLKEWTDYRVAIYLIDTNDLNPTWPEQPAK